MIRNYKGTADYIATWMKDYATKAGAKAFVLGLSGGIDSALCAQLCLRAGIPTVVVNMPCHSSSSAYDRAASFAKEIGLDLLKVDLSSAHAVIADQFAVQAPHDWNSKGSAGALRSCLRAPTLSFLAHATNGIIVGTGNRSEDRITRYFQKFGDGCVDFSPIADLHKSEVYALFKFLAEEKTGSMGPGAAAIYNAKPSADLWGADSGQEDEKELGISYEEIEWADREDVATEEEHEGYIGQTITLPGIVCYDRAPELHPKWWNYTPRQQEIISKLHHMEKVSRHKMNPNMPVCIVHSETDLVG